MQTPSQVVNRGDRQNESGLFQSFTSYLSSYAADDPPEPSDEELGDTLCTVDCIQACPMDNIFSNIMQLPSEGLSALVHALLEHLPQDSAPVVAVVKAEPGSSNPIKLNGHRPVASISNYNPSIVYVLEFASMLAIRDESCAQAVGKDVAEALQDVVRGASHLHPVIVSRAIFYLLNLLNASYEHSIVRAPVILHTISSLDQAIAEKSALPILKGLSLCLKGQGTLKNEIVNTPDFWSTIRGLHTLRDASGNVFELLQTIMEDSPSVITADNYEAAIILLNDFATAGRAGAVIEQKRDRNVRRSKLVKTNIQIENVPVTRGVKAINMVYQLSSRVPDLIEQSHLERTEAWTAYWSPIFHALSQQCTNPCRDIRHQAFLGLQRSLLSPALASADHQEWTAIFGEVLFPLILQLLKPEVYHSDPVGMSETRVQAATLLCKIFLHYLVLLSEWDGMLDLWLRILDIMDRLMNSGQGDSLVSTYQASGAQMYS
jgi:brefeldin A-resistance guanine nucleotide exchange factor 1